ncbi:MAG: nuclear transport factor 2 family protein [Novosphingobium sp.]
MRTWAWWIACVASATETSGFRRGVAVALAGALWLGCRINGGNRGRDVADRGEIIEKLNLYALAVDTRRWDLFDRIFAEHCEADYGPRVHWHQRDPFKADFATFHAPFDATQHILTNHQVEVEDERAWSLCYGSWRLVRRDAEGGPLWDGTGWYDDQWTLTHGGWRILKRVCRVVWSTGNPLVKQVLPAASFEDDCVSLHDEAAAGRLAYLNAVS